MRTVLTIIFILLLVSFLSYAQPAKGQFSIFGGLSMPQGDFANNDFGEDAGFAKTGFCLGAEYVKPLNSPGLSWVTNVSIIFNSVDADPIAEGYGEEQGVDLSGDAGSYLNIPVMTGIRYQSETSPTMQIYGLAQVGLNYMKPPTVELSAEYITAEMETESKTSFGFGIGAGMILNNKYNIGFRYLTFGEQDLESTIDIPGIGTYDEDSEMSLSMILITVGIALGSN